MTKEYTPSPEDRPLSPHLTIYKPQITSVLSITHRLTGFALYLGTVILAIWVSLNVYGAGEWANTVIASAFGKFFLFLWSFALYYHLCNGIRHLFWDMGKGYDIPVVRKSGMAVVAVSLLMTAGTWFMAL